VNKTTFIIAGLLLAIMIIVVLCGCGSGWSIAGYEL